MREIDSDRAEHLLTVQNEIGESPVWVPEEKRIYWTDTENSAVFSYCPDDHRTQRFSLPMPVTALVHRRGGGWIIVTKNGVAFWEPFTNLCEPITDPTAGDDSLVLNDGTADPAGRLIIGSMNVRNLTSPDGCLFSLGTDLVLRPLDSGLRVANGIGFSPDGRTMYLSEQWNSRILAYDYDAESGDASRRRIFAEADPSEGYPDGIVVDSEGFVWNGRWGGSRIVRYAPDGSLDRLYHLPVPVGTCVGFGGDEMRDLYITTAWYGLEGTERSGNRTAGDLFRIRTDVTGTVERRFAG